MVIPPMSALQISHSDLEVFLLHINEGISHVNELERKWESYESAYRTEITYVWK